LLIRTVPHGKVVGNYSEFMDYQVANDNPLVPFPFINTEAVMVVRIAGVSLLVLLAACEQRYLNPPGASAANTYGAPPSHVSTAQVPGTER
jgi:hypothetical protein